MGRPVTSLEGFTRKLSFISPLSDEYLLFRGHYSCHFKLTPSILRDQIRAAHEHLILRELVASHPSEFGEDKTTLEQLVRVQHYSLPTRLLDVTWNPLVALYFAVSPDGTRKEDQRNNGEVIVLRIKKAKVKFFDSDTVSCAANLAHLNQEQKASIDFRETDVRKFNEQTPINRLAQFIRAEKPYFKSEILPTDLKTVLCVKPKQNNRRILAQSGAFLVFGLVDELKSNGIDGISIDRIRIDDAHKEKITGELDRVAVNESTMFPDIERAARYILKKLAI